MKFFNSPIFRAATLSLLSLVIISCENDMSDLVTQLNNIKTLPTGRIDEIPEFEPYQNFEYTAQDLRDPFVISQSDVLEEARITIENITDGLVPDIDRSKEALEEFPLDTLRFKGSVTTNDGTKWALIFAPDSTIHRVIEGNHIGQNHGLIYSVADDKIELTEIIPDGLGNFVERNAALALIN